jgi:endonuclease-3
MRCNESIQWESIIPILDHWYQKQDAAGIAVPSISALRKEVPLDPWAVLASTIISLRTRDPVTIEATKRLLLIAPTPSAILKMDEAVIAKCIYPAGFYKTKAKNLKAIATILMNQYGGTVPEDMEALLSLPGVGRKTANLVRIEAYNLDSVCVDTHVHRISNRAGWVSTNSPDETEEALRNCLPKIYWKDINRLLVLLGQQVCNSRKPHCSSCCINAYCEKRGVPVK